MDISALAMGQATPKTPTVSAATGAFAALLAAFQSGAPPGGAPPPVGAQAGEEVANLGPIALSLNPDFLPAQPPISEQSGSDAKVKIPQLEALAALTMVSVTLPAMQTAQTSLEVGNLGKSSLPPVPSIEIAPTTAPKIDPSLTAPVDHDLARGKPTIPPTELPDEKPPVAIGTTPIAQIVAEAPVELSIAVTPLPASPKVTPKELGTKADPPKPASVLGGSEPTSVPAETRVEATSPGVEVDEKPADKAPGEKAMAWKEASQDKPLETVSAKADPRSPVSGPIPTSRTEIKEVQPLPRRDVQLVIRQIVDRIELMAAAKPRGGVTVQLQPEHLGTITMTVKSAAGAIEAHISASNDNVRSALDQNQAMLSQALEQRGLKLENVSVASQANSSTTYRQPQQQPPRQQPQGPSSTTSPDREIRISTMASPRVGHLSVAGVDLWI